MPSIHVLLLAADHHHGGSAGLRLDAEIRAILEKTRQHHAAGRLEIHPELAASADDMRHALLRHAPQIVHIASHAAGTSGIVLDDGTPLAPDRLRALFATFREVQVVVINACEGVPSAEALGDVVDHAIAMELPIDDRAAIRFSSWLYAGLAAGRDVPGAFALARDTVAAEFGKDHARPRLLSRPGSRANLRPARPPSAAEDQRRVRSGGYNRAEDNEVDGEAVMENKSPGGGANVARGNRIGGSLRMSNG